MAFFRRAFRGSCYVFGVSRLDFLDAELRFLESQGLLRRPAVARSGDSLRDAASNDYLGFGAEPVSRATLLACVDLPLGATASRLIHGTSQTHIDLEESVAEWVKLPAALLFSTGYTANVGALTALLRPSDVVVSDALNHASIIDGIRLSRASVRITPHLDVEAVASALTSAPADARRCVVVESYYSMDGDGPDLRQLRRVCDDHDAALIVDEAHALGVYGPQGGGRCLELGVAPEVLIGTLGKAVGAQGAFVAGTETLRTWLWNRARSFVFSTAPSPLLTRLAALAVERVRGADDRRARLHELCAEVRTRLEERRVPIAPSEGPILPVLVGDNARAVRAAEHLAAKGFRAQAIRPPTVPAGTARLRATIHATWSDADLHDFVEAVASMPRD